MYAGGQFAEFTPIDPELCIWVEKVMDDPPAGWRFYRANTALNTNLADGWFNQFFATVPDELMQTRMTGALATFVGCIYPSFNPAVHVQSGPIVFPPNVTHRRAVDWGASEEHAQTCVWGYEDGMGDWFVYDEYWSIDQNKITVDHAVEVLARSLAWGWPVPLHVFRSEDQFILRYADMVLDRLAEISREAADFVRRFTANPHGTLPSCARDHFGYTYGDPSRPGEIREFTRLGIQMAPASNEFYQGVNCVRSLLKINPFTNRPRIYIHPRCLHLIEEFRKYRWKQSKSDPGLLNPEVAKPVPLKRADDTVDALRYLIFSPTRSTNETPQSVDHRPITGTRRSVQLDHGQGRWRLVK
jgi:hypothetical protein